MLVGEGTTGGVRCSLAEGHREGKHNTHFHVDILDIVRYSENTWPLKCPSLTNSSRLKGHLNLKYMAFSEIIFYEY